MKILTGTALGGHVEVPEEAGDLELINAHSAELNEEAADVFEYQVIRSAISSSRLVRRGRASKGTR